MIDKRVRPLTREAFAPFGQPIEAPLEMSVAPGEIYGYWQVATCQIPGELEVGWLTVMQRPMELTQMERHVRTPEMIVPLDAELVIPVAAAERLDVPNAAPSLYKIEVFLVHPGQALLLHRCVWHWLPFPLDERGSCLIIFAKNTGKEDLVIQDLPEGEVIRIIS